MACASYLTELMENNSDLVDELNVLKEIYLDDITIEESSEGMCSIRLEIQPSTGENADKKLVSIVLVIIPFEGYPEDLPKLSLKCSRGLSESFVNELQTNLIQVAKDQIGIPMIYTLAEFVREGLTSNNFPSIECMICLNEFEAESNDTVKTSCCHYYHATCLLEYKNHIENEHKASENKLEDLTVPCPICRLSILNDFSKIREPPKTFKPQASFKYVPSEEMLQMRENMRTLFLRQKERGGIIDLEEEKKKYLITM